MNLQNLIKTYNAGEEEFINLFTGAGYQITDVTDKPQYWYKDIDFLVTNPYTDFTFSFEVKWDRRLADTKNLYLETENPRSKGGAGWFVFCEADYLAYGDAVNNCFYIFKMEELRAYVRKNYRSIPKKSTTDGSYGLIVPLENLWDIAQKIEL